MPLESFFGGSPALREAVFKTKSSSQRNRMGKKQTNTHTQENVGDKAKEQSAPASFLLVSCYLSQTNYV